MAIVKHEIPPGSGRVYLYEHHRVPGRGVVCTYLGRSDEVKYVPSIPEEGFPVTGKGYHAGHKAGQEAEKDEYGEPRAKEFDKHINEVIPEGELAGSHTRDGKILISKKIDPEYHGQLIVHERTEHEKMTGEEYKKEPETPMGGKGRTVPKEKMTLRQKRKIEYVMREYEAGRLKSGAGYTVTSRKQASAIAYSQARKIK